MRGTTVVPPYYGDLLCCPRCRCDLAFNDTLNEFSCHACRFHLPILDGIPVLFPCNVRESMPNLFQRYWDSQEKADLYDAKVEGGDDAFGRYNHLSEIRALTCYYRPRNLDLVLDAGTGTGRFLDTFPETTIKVGLDASLSLLRHARARGRGDLLVCGELEHLPFKSGIFGTVISCRVLQHLQEQERALQEMARVVRPGGDLIIEFYNACNLKTVYKWIRMNPRLRSLLNAPFRAVFKSMSPFAEWGLDYDHYNYWFEVKRWMRRAGLRDIAGRGTGFGYHKYLCSPFYIDAVLANRAPRFRERYYDACLSADKAVGGWVPFRYGMEKIVLKGTKQ